MTEIALMQDNLPATIQYEDPTGGRLVAWAKAASAAHQLAKALVRTSFVPDTFKAVKDEDGNVDPGNATAVIIMGDELGLSPLASLRGIYIFKGTPALYARTMRALALSHGHSMWNEVSTDTEVVVCGRRKGSDKVERVSWTIARATKAGYTNNQKYKTDPQAMLQAKADSEVARKIAADVLAGVPHSVEDLELSEVSTTTVTRTEPAAPKRVSRKPAPEPAAEPEFDAEPEPPAEDGITEAQLKMLHASFNDKGFKDRDDRLAYVREEIGIDVESSKDLTKDQASRVIDALQQLSDVS
jgi:hypothetical protein